MRSVLLLINSVLKAICWVIAIILLAGVALLVATTITIAYSISTPFGAGCLICFLGVAYLLFYRIKS